MRKCTYCAEEIQDEAIFCKHCKKDVKPRKSRKFFIFIIELKNLFLNLKKSSVLVFIFYIFAILVSSLIFNTIINWCLEGFDEINAEGLRTGLLYFSKFLFGIVISFFLYKIEKIHIYFLLFLSILIIKYLIAYILYSLYSRFHYPEFINVVMLSALIEIIIVFLTVVVFSFLFRKSENKFNYANVKNITRYVKDPTTNELYDTATCGKCGQVTKIAGYWKFIFEQKSDNHFCDNCGVFLNDNPFRICILYITCCMILVFLIVGTFSNDVDNIKKGFPMLSNHFLMYFIYIISFFQSAKGAYMGMKGIRMGIKRPL